MSKTKTTTIRLHPDDISFAKKLAEINGMKYPNYIKSIIHRELSRVRDYDKLLELWKAQREAPSSIKEDIMSYGMAICSECLCEVHQGGSRTIENGWFHCEDKTPRCEGGSSIYASDGRAEVKGKWCAADDMGKWS